MGAGRGEAALEAAPLKAGRRAEVFDHNALLANPVNSNLSRFGAIAKRCPELALHKLLEFLVASTPRAAGKWFVTAKTLTPFDQATALAWDLPCEPMTLTCGARDHLVCRPVFVMQ